MKNKVLELTIKWDDNTKEGDTPGKYGKLYSQADYYQKTRWLEYLPTKHPSQHSDFLKRLELWIDSVRGEKEKKILLEYLSKITFISRDDFLSLYQTALNRCIYQWIDEDIAVSKSESLASYSQKVEAELANTLFLPFTDSMDINEFFKVNNLEGSGYRPGLCSLMKFCESGNLSKEQIRSSMSAVLKKGSNAPYSRIVAMEDMVGSGSQVKETLEWLVDLNLGLKILFVPLVLCETGEDNFANSNYHKGNEYQLTPVLRIARSELIGPESKGKNNWTIAEDLADLVVRCRPILNIQKKDTFGFSNTGCSVVLYTNTPDNSLPIIYYQSSQWAPLFPRIRRV